MVASGTRGRLSRQPWRCPRTTLAALLALPVVLLVADALTPPSTRLGPLMVAAPVLSAVFYGPAVVLLVAVVTLGCVLAAGVANLQLGTANFAIQLMTMLVISAAAIVAAAVRQRRERQLAQARRVARVTQRVLLRPLPRRTESLMISSMYLAIEEEAEIGGDLYAVSAIGDCTRVLIGDVRGKGLGAVKEASSLLSAFRQATRSRIALCDVAPFLEHAFSEEVKEVAEVDFGSPDGEHGVHGPPSEGFVTAVVVDVPEEGGRIRIVNCGHSPPLLLRDGRVHPLNPTAPALPLGLGHMDEVIANIDTADFAVGDTLLLYTDGLIEARNAAGGFYPLPDRLPGWARYDPDELLQAIHTDLTHHFQARLTDDIAMVAIQRIP